MKAKLINELKELLSTTEKEKLYYNIVLQTTKWIEKLNKSVEISMFHISKRNCSLEFIVDDEYVNVEIADNNIEFRVLNYELMIFYDSDKFNIKYEELIKDFFHGNYVIINYFDSNNIKVADGMIWSNDYLSNFNRDKEFSRGCQKEIKSKKSFIGVVMVGH